MSWRSFLALGVLLALPLPAKEAEPASLDLTRRYVLINATKIKDGQRLLEEAAAAGYRLLLAGSVGGERRLVLERSASSSGAFEYRVIRDKELQPALEQAAAEGFRFHRRSFSSFAAAEKGPGPARRYQYRVLDTQRKSTLEKELNQAAREGWELAALVGLGYGAGQLAVLEKSLEMQVAPGEAGRGGAPTDYLLSAARRIGTLQRELSEKAAHGYRVRSGFLDGDEAAYVLEKTRASAEPCEYSLLSLDSAEKLEKAMNDAAARGFRVQPEGMFLRLFRFFKMEMVVAMEKAGAPPARFEYRVLYSSKEAELRNQLTEAEKQGFSVVGMIGYETIIVERALASASSEKPGWVYEGQSQVVGRDGGKNLVDEF